MKYLFSNYSKWIDKIESHSKELSSRYKNPSEIIIKNCKTAAERINKGISLIEKNEELKLAFQIAMKQSCINNTEPQFIKIYKNDDSETYKE